MPRQQGAACASGCGLDGKRDSKELSSGNLELRKLSHAESDSARQPHGLYRSLHPHRQSGRAISELGIFGLSMQTQLLSIALTVIRMIAMPSIVSAATCTPPASLQKIEKPASDYYIRLGTWFGDHRQFVCATDAFKRAENSNPNSAQIEYLLGLSLYSAGRAHEAVAPLKHSAELAPNDLQTRVLLARVLDELKRIPEAAQQWQEAWRISPQSPLVLDGLSRNLFAQGNYSSVINLLKSATSEELVLDLAQAYGKSGMVEQAAATLKAAVDSNPESFRLINALTTAYVIQRRLQDASVLTGNFAKLHPRDLDAQKLHLRVLVLNNEGASAKPLARRLLSAQPHDFYVLYLNGILEREDGDYQSARKHLEGAATINPNHAECRYNLGLTLAELGDSAGAAKQLQHAIDLGYDEPDVHFKLASALRDLGRSQEAEKELQTSQQLREKVADSAEAASKSADAAHEFEAGNTEKAITLYREALQATPDDTLLCYKLALALERSGDTAAERKALEH